MVCSGVQWCAVVCSGELLEHGCKHLLAYHCCYQLCCDTGFCVYVAVQVNTAGTVDCRLMPSLINQCLFSLQYEATHNLHNLATVNLLPPIDGPVTVGSMVVSGLGGLSSFHELEACFDIQDSLCIVGDTGMVTVHQILRESTCIGNISMLHIHEYAVDDLACSAIAESAKHLKVLSLDVVDNHGILMRMPPSLEVLSIDQYIADFATTVALPHTIQVVKAFDHLDHAGEPAYLCVDSNKKLPVLYTTFQPYTWPTSVESVIWGVSGAQFEHAPNGHDWARFTALKALTILMFCFPGDPRISKDTFVQSFVASVFDEGLLPPNIKLFTFLWADEAAARHCNIHWMVRKTLKEVCGRLPPLFASIGGIDYTPNTHISSCGTLPIMPASDTRLVTLTHGSCTQQEFFELSGFELLHAYPAVVKEDGLGLHNFMFDEYTESKVTGQWVMPTYTCYELEDMMW